MGTTAAQVPRWKTPGGLFLLVLAGTMLAYLPTLGSGFFSDDILYIVGNQTLQQWPLTQIFGLFTERTNPYEYLPLRDLSYRLDMALFGVSAWGFHLHNLLLYGLSCAAAWLAARSVINLLARGAGATPSPWDEVRQRRGAAAAAMLFAVHPAHVESVAWVAGRKDLLSGLLALLALHLYVQGLASGRVLWFRVSAAWVLFALALASKATVLPLALAAVLLAALAGRSATSRRWIGLATSLPFLAIAGLWMRLAMTVGGETQVRMGAFGEAVLRETEPVVMPLRILGRMAVIGLAPVRLRLIYDLPEAGAQAVLLALVGVLSVALAVWGGVVCWRRSSVAGMGVLFFVLFCLPFLQIVPFNTWSVVSERFLFLPCFGLGLILAPAIRPQPRARAAAAVLLLAGLGLTAWQARLWTPVTGVIEATAKYAPRHAIAQWLHASQVLLPQQRDQEARTAVERIRNPLARSLYSNYIAARTALAAGRSEEAIGYAAVMEPLLGPLSEGEIVLLLARLARQRGDWVQAARYYHQTLVRSRTQGEWSQARQGLQDLRQAQSVRLSDLEAAAREAPGDAVAVGTLANLHMQLFMLEDAEAGFRQILERSPSHPVARYNLGLTLLRQRRFQEAQRELQLATAAGLRNATVWNNLAIAAKENGDLEAAVTAFTRAAESDPEDCDPRINLGRIHLARHEGQAAAEQLQPVADGMCGEGAAALARLYLEQGLARRSPARSEVGR